METLRWTSGLNNYRSHTLEFSDTSTNFITELHDVDPLPVKNIHDIFLAHLGDHKLPIEVLYSGGLDSECVIASFLKNNIPVTAVTMRLLVGSEVVNTQDLYYATKFCQNNNVKHVIHDLRLDSFFGNGDHIKYAELYHVTHVFAITVFWLITKCQSFPIIGGDYTWPQTNIGKKIYSPHRHDYNCFDHYMNSIGLPGIGNMISHSLDSNLLFIDAHLKMFDNDINYKDQLLLHLGFPKLESRARSHGWETIMDFALRFDIVSVTNDLVTRFKPSTSTVMWNHSLADMISGEPGKNDEF